MAWYGYQYISHHRDTDSKISLFRGKLHNTVVNQSVILCRATPNGPQGRLNGWRGRVAELLEDPGDDQGIATPLQSAVSESGFDLRTEASGLRLTHCSSYAPKPQRDFVARVPHRIPQPCHTGPGVAL
eukprot:3128035-Pleurochrysis_carterae.AAC.1